MKSVDNTSLCVSSSLGAYLLVVGEGILGEATNGLALEVEGVGDGTAGQGDKGKK